MHGYRINGCDFTPQFAWTETSCLVLYFPFHFRALTKQPTSTHSVSCRSFDSLHFVAVLNMQSTVPIEEWDESRVLAALDRLQNMHIQVK